MPKMGIQRRAPRDRAEAATCPATSRLADALFSKTQQRVLSFLFGQPDRSFFATELIELTRSGSGAVQRELTKLVDSGLVLATTIGRQRHFQANAGAPIFEEIRSIVQKTVGLADPLRAALEPLRSKIERAFIYGSVAKGGATADSDIDVLIVSDEVDLEEIYSALASVERMLRRKINPNVYNRAAYERRVAEGNPFVTRILSSSTITLIEPSSTHE